MGDNYSAKIADQLRIANLLTVATAKNPVTGAALFGSVDRQTATDLASKWLKLEEL